MLKEELQRILFNFKGHQSTGAAQEEILTLFKNHIKDKMPEEKDDSEDPGESEQKWHQIKVRNGWKLALEETAEALMEGLTIKEEPTKAPLPRKLTRVWAMPNK